MGVITISREFGSGGEIIASSVAKRMDFLLVNKDFINKGLASYGFKETDLSDEKIIKSLEEDKKKTLFDQYISAFHEFIYDLAIRKNLVILGRGGQILFQDFPPSLHVKITSPLKERIARVAKQYQLSPKGSQKLVKEQDEDKKAYIEKIFGQDWLDISLYDIIINTGKISVEDTVDIIALSFNAHGETWGIKKEEAIDEKFSAPSLEEKEVSFMHPSEEEFAKMLDFYSIKWEYEPRTFPLEWDSEGNITEAFSPDFYLPEQNIYVELTTQRQKLVWKKNKKVRRLKEMYPDMKIKIIYNKDYQSLLRKFNLDEEE